MLDILHPFNALLSLQNISLTNFKNYPQARFTFSERIIGICGPNGVGKTNLLDAIYYLCFTRSYFTKSDSLNVLSGTQGFRIEGNFMRDGHPLQAVCILRETGRKEFQVQGEAYTRFADHIGRIPCVIIAPDDVQIITGGSEERRRLLDALLSQLDNEYLKHLIDYNKVLQQRNSYLKSLAEKKETNTALLQVYDQQLATYGIPIYTKRNEFLQEYIPRVYELYRQIAGADEPVELEYESQLLHQSFQSLLSGFRDKDQLLQRTMGGIHRDDLSIRLNGQPFKTIASQGQRKSLLFALKLAEFETLKEEKGYPPLLLLDDVFEKLDEQRMHNLLTRVCTGIQGQLFITDTHEDRIRQHFDKLGKPFSIVRINT
jgi:DNA replication and repair protein RecF